jgi:hypothetical protein
LTNPIQTLEIQNSREGRIPLFGGEIVHDTAPASGATPMNQRLARLKLEAPAFGLSPITRCEWSRAAKGWQVALVLAFHEPLKTLKS